MRHVGEAVRGHTVMSRGAQLKDNTQQVHLIGIATWGIVDHREHVIGKQVNSSKEKKVKQGWETKTNPRMTSQPVDDPEFSPLFLF